ncbi:MAG: copper oxidase [Methylomonas sp.]|nr:copper oxidase [Methylomonas sp.]PPD19599.1 MAG: copper oxidase [Methylomonas sp.]PPD25709.1 MAG: copper oxidase [Methylomonas sp.]PPD36920.1 MAG: copper oxidase [Methylomonas sp.]PPD38702.1 MAG: copper oxidase [Methylomonas sp.]
MNKPLSIALSIWAFAVATDVSALEIREHNQMMNHGDGHMMDMDGAMVMGHNPDTLPGGCDRIAATKEITVHAGHKYSEKFPGTMWAFDQQEFQFEPCTKLTVHFVNEDQIRHQWMMHGLPKYLYPGGMFHLEVSGPGKVSGTLILPPGDKTYLVHCDIAQHMEKGMKAQLKVGKGGDDLPSIPGVTASLFPDDYSGKPFSPEEFQAQERSAVEQAAAQAQKQVKADAETGTANSPPAEDASFLSGSTIVGLALGLILAPVLSRRFKGMSPGEVVATVLEMVAHAVGYVVDLLSRLIKTFTGKKSIALPDK